MFSLGKLAEGYYTLPEAPADVVRDLVVGRRDFGSVRFLGDTDRSELPATLDRLVQFKRLGEVIVYPRTVTKPRRGTGLNKPAEITLHNCWPRGIESPEAFVNELRAVKGTTFVGYCGDAGTWVFCVEHFTRYGLKLDDDDDDEDDDDEEGDLDGDGEADQGEGINGVDDGEEGDENRGEGAGGDADYEGEGDYADDEDDRGYDRRDQRYGGRKGRLEYDEASMGGSDEEANPEDEDLENGEDLVDDEADLSPLEEDPPSSSVFTNSSSAGMYGAPTMMLLPQRLGLEPRKFQLMKSSLFAVSDELPTTATPGARSTMYTPPSERQSFLFPFKRQTTGSPPIIMPPPVPTPVPVPKRATPRPVPPREALSAGRTHLSVDAGLWMGRSFRATYAPGLSIIHSGFPSGRRVGENPLEFGAISVERPFISTLKPVNYEQYLEKHLQNSAMIPTSFARGAPCWQLSDVQTIIKANVELSKAHKNNAMPSNPLLTHTYQIWSLVDALWGTPPGGTPKWQVNESAAMKPMGIEYEAYVELVLRRTQLSNWLVATVADSVAGDSSENHLLRIFSLLTGLQLTEALRLAIAHKDFRLATLIGQACSPSLRKDLQLQLAEWEHDSMLDPRIFNPERLHIYKLLSGDTFSVSQRLDWKRTFALTFWYGSENETRQEDIADAVARYSRRVEGHLAAGIPPPLPPYLESKRLAKTGMPVLVKGRQDKPTEGGIAETEEKDTLYRLLRLYCDRSYGVGRVIGGGGHTSAPLDAHISWHLCSLLVSLGKYAPPPSLHRLYHSYAAQLEAVGLWHWAIYVLLQLPVDSSCVEDPRLGAVKAILERHISLESTPESRERDRFLVDRLHIPVLWIHEAKAWRAGYEHKEELMLANFMAEPEPSWQLAHRLLAQTIAPDFLLQGREEELYGITSRMKGAATTIPGIIGWDDGGGIYHSYLHLRLQLPKYLNMLASRPDDREAQRQLHELQGDAEELTRRLSSFVMSPDASPQQHKKHRVARTDMADKVIEMLLQIKRQHSSVRVPDQPMPELLGVASDMLGMSISDGHRLNLLRSMTDAYLIALQS